MVDKTQYIWIDGEMKKLSESKVPFLTHSFHYGSGVFEGIRCYKTENGRAIFRLSDHIERLFFSAETMGLKINFSQKEIEEVIKKLIKKNNLEECYIRPLIWHGEKMGMDPVDTPVHFGIAVWEWTKYLKKDEVKVGISKVMKTHPQTTVLGAKISGHYVNSVLASRETKSRGFDEGLLLDFEGNIAEGPVENIIFCKGKEIHTPTIKSILPGLTRASVLTIAEDLGYKIFERDIKPEELKDFDEAFFVGTAVEINSIASIDDFYFTGKDGKTFKKLKEIFVQVIHGENDKYEKWLSRL
ncbi:MAG: branched-chain amino acid transaminase [Candidatus Moranbacteria bacterium]|nr:branched-chain amino acid transaminase [Candidatus Moranbacteria bacterium]